MSEAGDRIRKLRENGYGCSQVMIILSHEMRNIDNPELVRAMGGLRGGMCSGKTCGVLSGGSCLLGTFMNQESDSYKKWVKEYVDWFEQEFGNTDCKDLLASNTGDKNEFCAGLIEKSFGKCINILHDKDIATE